jgi:branched-chain amino acid transport system permease protein
MSTESATKQIASVINGNSVGLIRKIRPAWLGVLLITLATLFFTTTQSAYSVYVYDTILFACMGAIALQLLQGTAGLVSVGNSGFLLIGAFSAIYLMRAGVPFPLDVIGATVFSGVVGFIVGIPALRLRSLFLALATLAVYFIAVYVGNQYQTDVPSAQFSGFAVPTLFGSFGLDAAGRDWAWLLLIIVSLLLLGAGRLMAERSGRAMRMMRDHELIAPTLGISVRHYKLLIFVLSSMVIGCQGALTAHFSGNITTDDFTLTLAFQYVAMIMIGGLDSLAGAVIGAVIVIGIPAWVPSLVGHVMSGSQATIDGPNIALIIYGVLIILFVTGTQDGVVGLFKILGKYAARLMLRVVPAVEARLRP